MSRCSCDSPAYRVTDELAGDTARVRCGDCTGKVGKVALDALAVFGISADSLEPGAGLGYEITIKRTDPPTTADRPLPPEGDGGDGA